jgi:hypothetical protein
LSSARLANRHQKLYPKQYLVVCYEKLFAEPEQTMCEICNFLDETFYPQMLAYGEIKTHSPQKQHDLLKRDLYFIRSHAQESMKYFGYRYDDLQLSWREQVLYGLALPINLATLLAGRLGAGLGQREIIQTELSL